MLRKFIGDRAFYKKLLAVMIPILIQNVITNFVSLLDNIMVGQVGTEPMSGVAIVNQIIFVFNLCIFAANAAAGIYAAQYYGKGDMEGVRNSFRLKIWFSSAILLLFMAVIIPFQDFFINTFLHQGEEALNLEATLGYAKEYLGVMLIGLLPFMISQNYGSILRETGHTVVPMRAGIIAVFVNLVFNYIFIFGKLGVPAMGAAGAAIATVISRFAETAIIVIWTHKHAKELKFAEGLFTTMRVPAGLLQKTVRMGFPLILNEFLWSSGMAVLNQCYSIRGLEVVSACNIASTISNLFFCAFMSMGVTVSIIIGQLLGAGELERAVDEDRKLIAFSVAISVVIGAVMAVLAPKIPAIYNTIDLVKSLATEMIIINALMMPLNAFSNNCYFTLRAGGKTWITFAFDSAFAWVVCIPAAVIASRLTNMAIIPIYALVHILEIIKVVVGSVMLKKRAWVNNLVSEE